MLSLSDRRLDFLDLERLQPLKMKSVQLDWLKGARSLFTKMEQPVRTDSVYESWAVAAILCPAFFQRDEDSPSVGSCERRPPHATPFGCGYGGTLTPVGPRVKHQGHFTRRQHQHLLESRRKAFSRKIQTGTACETLKETKD